MLLSHIRARDLHPSSAWRISTSHSPVIALNWVPEWRPARSRRRRRSQFAQGFQRTTRESSWSSLQATPRAHLPRSAPTTISLSSSVFRWTISVTCGSARNFHLASRSLQLRQDQIITMPSHWETSSARIHVTWPRAVPRT